MRTVLVATRADRRDVSIDAVSERLRARGARVWALSTDRFPGPVQLSVGDGTLLWQSEDGALDLNEVDAAWMRHTEVGASIAEDLHPDYRDAVLGQANIAVWSALACVPGLWVDPPHRLSAVPESVAQLHLARACGLTPPRTLMSNDPDRIRAFAETCTEGAIFKLLQSSALQLQDEDGGRHFVPTQALEPEHLADPDRLRACPMVFQERVPKALELRVTAIGRRLFTAALDVRAEGEALDWRHVEGRAAAFRAYDGLDPAIEAGLHRLLDTLGLNFATADLLVTPAGQTVFLEINTVSYFAWVEAATGLPISEALTDLLMGEGEPRRV